MTGGKEQTEQILEGRGLNDYERYIRTDELLALQKAPDEWMHRDELLFQVTHQSSELWLKLALSEIDESLRLLESGRYQPAIRLLHRVDMCIGYTIAQIDILEQMTPWDYQQVRKALGHGSGFDSPGFVALRKAIPPLGAFFFGALQERGITLVDLFVHHDDHEDLYQLAECLISLDELLMDWRSRHFKMVERTIGFNVKGTQGTPVEVLGAIRDRKFFPELWDVRSTLSDLADEVL